MNRRDFIKTTTMLPAAAAVSAMPQFVSAALAATTDKWRVFEVTTKVGVLKPAGATRVWLPLPLTADTDFQKNLGSTWTVEGGTAAIVNDGKYGAEMLYFEATDTTKVPAVQLTSRFATRDRAVDLTKPGSAGKATREEIQKYLAPTELIPTDGIVRDTAREITKNVNGGDIEKARAIYEWIVENTYRDPKTRGCGVGDIKYHARNEKPWRQMRRSQCAVRRSGTVDRHSGAGPLRRARGEVGIWLSQLGRWHGQRHAGATLPGRFLHGQPRLGTG